MEQKRLLLAFVLSAAVLFGWTYFMGRLRPQQPDNTNAAQQTATASPSPTASASASVSHAITPTPQPAAPTATAPDATLHRTVTITTPLYEVKLDSKGAVATSWIITKNKDPEKGTMRPIYSVAGNKNNPQSLQLIPSDNLPENLRADARSTPLRLYTGDANLDAQLSARNYQINGVDDNGADSKLNLNAGEQKTITMTLRDAATGLEVVKSFRFNAETYSIDLGSKLTRGGQPVSGVKLAIGPSIGDQGVPRYTFYSAAPDGIATVDGKVYVYHGKNIHEAKEHPDQQAFG